MNSGGEGSSYEELEEAIKSHPDERKLPHLGPESTFRITVDSFGKVMSLQEHNERIRGLSCIPFKLVCYHRTLMLDYKLKSLEHRSYLLWEVGGGDRKLIPTYQLKSRSYLCPTAVDAEMAFLMANQAKATPGKLVYDPFVGTGSIRFGAITMMFCSFLGADIDIRVVRDGRGPDCNVWSNFEQKLTMVKTSPYTEELASAAWIKHLEFKENHAKWLELRRGPIGFSAYSKSKSKSERQRKEMASHLMVTDFTLPLKSYKLSHLRQQRKGRSNGWQNVPTTVAYYGLKTPPYNLVRWFRTIYDLGKVIYCMATLWMNLSKQHTTMGTPYLNLTIAAEVWNHDFFWEPMQPGGGDMPKLGLLEQIEKDFGSFNFREKFVETALSLFGSGWVWLVCNLFHLIVSVKRQEKRLAVPILNLDMWEHAYYLDYKNDKAKYVSTFVNHLVSWNAATVRMARAEAFVNLGEPKIPIA
ncbi:hypothetical protein V6N11_072387 [Hibiscus sabdariffa]|uniref:superoxide dismutase n=1 Tax=Hibiscus sabdariffa TaxID=183260 RepID=A0ABR2U2W3_9ROSI